MKSTRKFSYVFTLLILLSGSFFNVRGENHDFNAKDLFWIGYTVCGTVITFGSSYYLAYVIGRDEKPRTSNNRVKIPRPKIKLNDETIKKKCIACGQEFPATIDYFFKGYCLHGLRSKCKTCHVNECSNREITPKSRQKAIEHGRQYYQENKANRL